MRALRGNLVAPFQMIERGQIEVIDNKIRYVGPRRQFEGEVVNYGDATIVPGFIDVHVHGYAGHDVMDPDTNSIRHIAEHLAARGVTGFLATLQTAPKDELLDALRRVKRVMEEGTSGARVLGAHLEGPFISRNRMGAQQDFVREPTRKELEDILEAAGDILKIVTLAPEIQGGLEAVQFLRKRGGVVSAGHTDAS